MNNYSKASTFLLVIIIFMLYLYYIEIEQGYGIYILCIFEEFCLVASYMKKFSNTPNKKYIDENKIKRVADFLFIIIMLLFTLERLDLQFGFSMHLLCLGEFLILVSYLFFNLFLKKRINIMYCIAYLLCIYKIFFWNKYLFMENLVDNSNSINESKNKGAYLWSYQTNKDSVKISTEQRVAIISSFMERHYHFKTYNQNSIIIDYNKSPTFEIIYSPSYPRLNIQEYKIKNHKAYKIEGDYAHIKREDTIKIIYYNDRKEPIDSIFFFPQD